MLLIFYPQIGNLLWLFFVETIYQIKEVAFCSYLAMILKTKVSNAFLIPSLIIMWLFSFKL